MALFEDRHIKLSPDQLQELMDEHDISQEELGEVIDVHQPNISAMVNGKRSITKKMTKRIYEGLEWYLKPMTKAEKESLRSWYKTWSSKHPWPEEEEEE